MKRLREGLLSYSAACSCAGYACVGAIVDSAIYTGTGIACVAGGAVDVSAVYAAITAGDIVSEIVNAVGYVVDNVGDGIAHIVQKGIVISQHGSAAAGPIVVSTISGGSGGVIACVIGTCCAIHVRGTAGFLTGVTSHAV